MGFATVERNWMKVKEFSSALIKIATSRDFIILVCALLSQFLKHGIVQLVVFSLNFESQRGVARGVIIILTMKKH